jgi:hypothetical protein
MNCIQLLNGRSQWKAVLDMVMNYKVSSAAERLSACEDLLLLTVYVTMQCVRVIRTFDVYATR